MHANGDGSGGEWKSYFFPIGMLLFTPKESQHLNTCLTEVISTQSLFAREVVTLSREL